MQRFALLWKCFLVGLLFWLPSCKKDTIDPNLPSMKLSIDNVTGKSGKTIDIQVSFSAPYGFKDLLITKSINLQQDMHFGNNGTLTATPASAGQNQYTYNFSYVLNGDEVDKLVGFNFKLTDSKGHSVEKDLTVNTTVSGAQNIYSHKWKLISKMWTSISPASETIEDCEKDNVYQWNRDSSITIGYGSSGCTFDGFNVYDKWTLSDDEKTFTQVYHSLFDPSNVTVEKYNVRSISKDKLVMDIKLDLSVFGPPYTDHEVFVYTYEALP